MVLKMLVSLFYSFIIPRRQRRIKEAPSSSCEVIESSKAEKDVEHGLAESLAESDLCEAHESCCVCLSRLKEGEDMKILPCLHKFHKDCIDRWFSACRKTCPMCRFSMEDNKSYVKEVLTEEMIIYFSSFHVAGF